MPSGAENRWKLTGLQVGLPMAVMRTPWVGGGAAAAVAGSATSADDQNERRYDSARASQRVMRYSFQDAFRPKMGVHDSKHVLLLKYLN